MDRRAFMKAATGAALCALAGAGHAVGTEFDVDTLWVGPQPEHGVPEAMRVVVKMMHDGKVVQTHNVDIPFVDVLRAALRENRSMLTKQEFAEARKYLHDLESAEWQRRLDKELCRT